LAADAVGTCRQVAFVYVGAVLIEGGFGVEGAKGALDGGAWAERGAAHLYVASLVGTFLLVQAKLRAFVDALVVRVFVDPCLIAGVAVTVDACLEEGLRGSRAVEVAFDVEGVS
jgi:hypothetical protein